MVPWVAVAAGLGLAWGYDEFSRWRPTPVSTAINADIRRRPTGPQWKLEHQPYNWPNTESGRRSFVRFMAQRLLAQKLLPPVAVPLFIAHVARETGYGRAIWNNNFGNEKQYWGGPWHALNGVPFMSFATAEEGLAHAVNRIRRQWPRPFMKMLAGDTTWYGDMGIAGYYEYRPPGTDPATGRPYVGQRHTAETIGPTQVEYNGTVTHVRRLLAT